MIKGCSRKVIVVKKPGNGIFEEAYFILNPGESGRKQYDFLLEANRIIDSESISYGGKNGKNGIFRLILGFVLGMAVSLPTAYFFF